MSCHGSCSHPPTRHVHTQRVMWLDGMLWGSCDSICLFYMTYVLFCVYSICFLYVCICAGFIISFCVVKPEGNCIECKELLPETTPSHEGVKIFIVILSFKLLFHVSIRRSTISPSTGRQPSDIRNYRKTLRVTLISREPKTVINDCKSVASIRRKHLPQPLSFGFPVSYQHKLDVINVSSTYWTAP
jgi:hypothetical protein